MPFGQNKSYRINILIKKGYLPTAFKCFSSWWFKKTVVQDVVISI